jgi:predicted permease
LARGTIRILEDLLQDFRYAARTVLPRAGFLVGTVSLGLAIGAATAVYSTADWLLNRSPGGVVDPERVVTLGVMDRTQRDLGTFGFNYGQYVALRDLQDVFTETATYAKVVGNFSSEGRADQIVIEYASGTYFPLLGVRPELGRLFGPEDDVEGGEVTAVLSHGFWQSHFGGSSDITGRVIRLNGHDARVIGVLPRAFDGYNVDWNGPTSVWVPINALLPHGRGGLLRSTSSFMRIIARVPHGVPRELVSQRAQPWLDELPPLTALMENADTIVVEASATQRIARRDEATGFLGALLVVCGLVLLAACFNVANFFLGRAVRRTHEIGVRISLGAGRGRIFRQLLAESILLGGTSAIVAGLVAWGLARALAPWPFAYLDLPARTALLSTEGAIDLRMFAAAAALAGSTAILFGLMPMLASIRTPLASIRGHEPRWSWSGFRVSLRQVVLVLQVGLAVVLSITAGLYVQTFARVAQVDSEFVSPDRILIARVVPVGMTRDEGTAFHEALMTRLRMTPEVSAAGIGWNPPFRQGFNRLALPGETETLEVGSTAADPGFFEALGIPVVAGRAFRGLDEDADGVIINRIAAERLWRGQDVIGRTLVYGSTERRVVGVVERQHCRDLLTPPEPCAWQPFTMGTSSGYLRIRTTVPPLEFAPQLRALVYELSPDAAVAEEQALDEFLRDYNGGFVIAATSSAGLAAFGIALLVIGCISLFLSLVRDSLRELAIRMALGATHWRIAGRITGHGLVLIGGGLAMGVLAALFVVRAIGHQFYGVEATDPLIYSGAAVIILTTGLISIGYSASVAARTEPAVHLKSE